MQKTPPSDAIWRDLSGVFTVDRQRLTITVYRLTFNGYRLRIYRQRSATVGFIEEAVLPTIDRGKLIFADAITPVSIGTTGGIDAGIGTVSKDILDGKDRSVGGTGKLRADETLGGGGTVPVGGVVTAVV